MDQQANTNQPSPADSPEEDLQVLEMLAQDTTPADLNSCKPSDDNEDYWPFIFDPSLIDRSSL